MQVTCPACRQRIPDTDFNVATDIAYCRNCQTSHSLAQLIQNDKLDRATESDRSPAGTWARASGRSSTIGASHRSLGKAAGLLFACLFWNGIVSVFVLVNLASTLNLLGWTPPHWFPAPEMEGGPMGVGITLFLWIFLTPFMVIGAGLAIGFVLSLGGKTEIEIDPRRCRIFTGVGPIGWSRSFDPSSVKSVELQEKRWRNKEDDPREQQEICVELDTGKTYAFGSSLPEARRNYLGGELRRLLLS